MHPHTPPIDTPDALEALCDRAIACGRVALDTEFVWERTYYPQLGLVQIGLPGQEAYLVDTVALPRLDGLDRVLQAPHVQLILHDALQDLQIIARHTDTMPTNIFDTRRAAGLAGLSSTTSLANLLHDLLAIDLAKDATRSNWLQRPLSDTQMRYAREDVLYLHEAAALLAKRIQQLGHTMALQEEMQTFERADLYGPASTGTLFARFRSARMPQAVRARLYQLVQWREQEAQRADRPRRHIMPDAPLVALAYQDSGHAAPRLKPARRHAPVSPRLTAAANQFLAQAPPLQPEDLPDANQSAQKIPSELKQAIAQRKAAMVERATSAGIDPDLVATRAELTAIVLHEAGLAAPPPDHLRDGWRYPFLSPPPGPLSAQLDLPV